MPDPDGESAPADIQPVIRVGNIDTAQDLLPEMLAELAERFARAAAAESAKAAKRKKNATSSAKAAIPQTGAAAVGPQAEKGDVPDEGIEDAEQQEGSEELEAEVE